jgi:8-oxo-dGTP diphosphatase
MPATMAGVAWDNAMYCQRCGHNTEMREIDGRQRPVCLACGAVTYLDPKLAVAVVIERDNKVLLGLRAEGSREAGKWGIPAGFVDQGEVVENAAVREMAEEVGLHVELGPVLGVYSEPDEAVVLVVYPALSVTGDAVASDDLSEIGWFSPDDLPALAFSRDIEILSAWERWRATRAVV